jgi:DegV family protein with EDD domain
MVRIVADTTSSIPVPTAQAQQIAYLPQIIIFGDESYRDDCEIDTATFLSKLKKSSQLPKTAAPPPALYSPFFKQSQALGEAVIVIAPSSEVSGTVRSATIAAQDFPGVDIRVIDTRTIAGGLGSIVFKAVEWARQGMDVDTLEAKIKELASRVQIYVLVDTLEYLYKGGRIGGAQALVGSLLQVKPILTLRDGRTESVETQRTKSRGLARLKEIVLNDCPRGTEAMLTVSHCDAEPEARQLAADFATVLGVESIPTYILPPAIVVHAGPKTLAVNYFVAPHPD